MKISPLAKLGMLGTFAAGTALSAVLIGSAHHASAPTQIVVRQDAATAAMTTSAPAVKHAAAPKPAASTSTAVNRQPAAVQEAPVVTDPTQAPAPAASDTASTFFQPVTEKPGPGNAPSSTSGNSIPTATADPAPSN